jgi:2-polyprenyl-3-methyl-5-hydroxy-6-metoxy-1,4-benzoquinol methylase
MENGELLMRSIRYDHAPTARLVGRIQGRVLAAFCRAWGLLGRQPHRWESWLQDNRLERMDATRQDLFDPARCDFHLDRYDFACRYSRGRRVADIACGTGYGSAQLRAAGGADLVFGIDSCDQAIAYARQYHAPPGVEFRVGPAHRTGMQDASVDLVVSFETLEHLDDEGGLLGEFLRILMPGGVLVLSTPNDWGLASAPFHVRNYDAAQLSAAVGRLFEIDRLYSQNSGCVNRPENRGQPRGIVETTADNTDSAECFILVARKSDVAT